MLYLIGSLRNPEIPNIANRLREAGWEVFDDWYAAGPEADDKWRDYEKGRGHTYGQALAGHAARNVYAFDRRHLDRCRAAVLVLPAGKSGHLELGYVIGTGRPGYILLDTPDRWDVMYQFATGVFNTVEELIDELKSPADLVPEVLCPHCWLSPANPHFGVCLSCAGGLRANRDSGGDRPLRRTWAEEELLRRLD